MVKYKKNTNKSKPTAKKSTRVFLNADQTRAKYALKEITEITHNLSPEEQKEFRSYVQSLPARIQINGLGQAVAFCRSRYTENPDKSKPEKKGKGAQAYKTLYQLISNWLCNGELAVYDNYDDLLKAITSEGMQKYRIAQTELMAFLGWVQKFTLAFIESEQEERAEDQQ